MMYGKLENGNLTVAPKDVVFGDKRIINPTDEILAALGYMEIVFTDMPETEAGYHAEPSWEIQEEKLVRVWETVADEPIEPTSPTVEERVTMLELDVTETKEALDMILSGVTE